MGFGGGHLVGGGPMEVGAQGLTGKAWPGPRRVARPLVQVLAVLRETEGRAAAPVATLLHQVVDGLALHGRRQVLGRMRAQAEQCMVEGWEEGLQPTQDHTLTRIARRGSSGCGR